MNIRHKYSKISKDNPIKNNEHKSGKSGNPTDLPKGSLNRKIIAREYLAFLQEEVNPLTGIKELLSNEDMISLALIHNAKKGCVSTYKYIIDLAYTAIKQSIEVTIAETPILKQLDLDVI